MGFTSLDNQYGPSIAIGGVDLKGLDLAYGYTALANMGVLKGQASFAPAKPDESEIQPVAILTITNSRGEVVYDVENARAERRVAPAEHSFMITDILTDPGAHCQTFGCGGLSVPGYRAAIKTGASQPFDPNGPLKDKTADTWAFGYTADYVVGAWAGNSDRTPVSNIYSTTIAYPIMREMMLAAYNGQPQTPFQTPSNVKRGNVCAPVARFPSVVTAPGARGPQPVPTSQSCGNDLAIGR
jgi:penicillin-binding protein 1C